MEAAKLVKMANQIAENQRLLPHEEAVAATAAHLRAFWAPSMRRELQAHLAAGGEGVSAVVREAVSLV